MKALGRIDDPEPVSGHDAGRRGPHPDLVDQNFRRRTRHPVQARLLQLGENRAGVASGKFFQPEDFLGTERVHVHGREITLEHPEQIDIPLQPQLGIDAALDQDLGSSQTHDFPHLPGDLSKAEREGAVLMARAIERAEPARNGAYVGVIDIAADRVSCDPGVGLLLSDFMRCGGERLGGQIV